MTSLGLARKVRSFIRKHGYECSQILEVHGSVSHGHYFGVRNDDRYIEIFFDETGADVERGSEKGSWSLYDELVKLLGVSQ